MHTVELPQSILGDREGAGGEIVDVRSRISLARGPLCILERSLRPARTDGVVEGDLGTTPDPELCHHGLNVVEPGAAIPGDPGLADLHEELTAEQVRHLLSSRHIRSWDCRTDRSWDCYADLLQQTSVFEPKYLRVGK